MPANADARHPDGDPCGWRYHGERPHHLHGGRTSLFVRTWIAEAFPGAYNDDDTYSVTTNDY
jgi:hypothetical protein